MNAGKLAEALRELIEAADSCAHAVNTSMMDAAIESARNTLAAYEPVAAGGEPSVPEMTDCTWQPPDVTVNVERVGRFKSGDEWIVRVTYRSSDDGRRMTNFYSSNKGAAAHLHAMLAALDDDATPIHSFQNFS